MEKKNIISFCSGAGLLDHGFLSTNSYKLCMVCDIDATCRQTLRHHYPDIPIFEDIMNLTPEMIFTETGLAPGQIFAAIGGPPCQDFTSSIGGKRRGFECDNGRVFLKYIELLNTLRPQFVVIENVKGMGKEYRAHAASLLENLGYHVHYQVYDMSKYGVPQRRERVVFLASLTQPMTPLQPLKQEPLTVRMAFHPNPPTCNYAKVGPKLEEIMKNVEPCSNWQSLRVEYLCHLFKSQKFVDLHITPDGKRKNSSTGLFRRLDWDRPAPTLLTAPTQRMTLMYHPELQRVISVEEAKRIMTVPDDYFLAGSLTKQYKQLGNGVPCEFGRQIALHLLKN